MSLLPLLLIVIGLILLAIARRGRRSAGLPEGRVEYSDTGAERRPEAPLFSPRYRLTGRPDYLVEHNGAFIPVEVKSRPAPDEPYESHIFQLTAYCLLVEETYGKRPPYGIIRYRDRGFQVPYTAERKRALELILEQMRTDLHSGNVARSHDDPARCARCGYRHLCEESLV